MEPTYFTCDLEQAVKYQCGKKYETVTEFIDLKARQQHSSPAVGFFSLSQGSEPWSTHILTFGDVQRGSMVVAKALSTKLGAIPKQTIALICPSSPEFLFTWLAIIRLGHAALLIAPQCSPSSVSHLCRSCEVKHLFYDEVYQDLAEKASAESANSKGLDIDATIIPFANEDIFDVISRTPSPTPETAQGIRRFDIAYLHHTSGTSTGIPKPIPQTHHGAVGVLPRLDGTGHASFTTTPLYHGGIADLFRAWTSDALMWLFPGKDHPITAANVCRCLDAASSAVEQDSAPPVKYFSSVPYILQMMAEDRVGLKYLQDMDVVGVGGAALPAEIGDKLVLSNVNLISRFGSAECGFLMSSCRDFKKDKEWQYLRIMPGQEHLKFEPQENDGLSELVIQPGWPHMAKHNRDDGSYATADLFAAHSRIPNAWRYHSRADSQLTLVTGKKFDPAPLEDAIRASSPLVEDVLVFGNENLYPGVLIFRSKSAISLTDDDFLRGIAPMIERLNRDSQSHARIPRSMLLPMPYDQGSLEKSSKGTILRSRAEERYASIISRAYSADPSATTSNVSDEDILENVRKIVTNIVGDRTDVKPGSLSDDSDLFSFGIDSIGCIQIRHALCRLIPDGSALPLTVVEDQGMISRLSALILRIRSGEETNDIKDTSLDQHALMLDLVKRYSTFEDSGLSPIPSTPSCSSPAPSPVTTASNQEGVQILLTGPTGSLGSHILHQLLCDPRVSHIHLFVRGETAQASRDRVLEALSSRLLPVPIDFGSRTTIWQCTLSDPLLGLSPADYATLASRVDVIIHLAWSVNFLLPLRSFETTHLAGLRNLINFSLTSSSRPRPPRFVFCSSVASVSAYQTCNVTGADDDTQTATGTRKGHTRCEQTDTLVPELPVSDMPAASGPTGYARSKWVAEAMCVAAHTETRLNSRISISRVGQLSAATDTGVWSKTEAYPLMLSSSRVTGVLPDLKHEVLGWLPVDLAARAFVEDALKGIDHQNRDRQQPPKIENIPVHHVLNPSTELHWSDLLARLSSRRHQPFKAVPADEWLRVLSSLQEQNQKDTTGTAFEGLQKHPSFKLLGFWKSVYGSSTKDPQTQETPNIKTSPPIRRYDMDKTYARMPCLRDQQHSGLDDEYLIKTWDWIIKNV
ncbi:hypothetical protein H2204_001655 [Knufia peltigerae]|uniref:Carrier domain-containing protein n=1 Tax=Knufia peltigerae TaxID=1002370 RepID=A0AA38YCZ4_9EURO|nr:hypothetical protein H2204_001655 [Knufia peltigerae]